VAVIAWKTTATTTNAEKRHHPSFAEKAQWRHMERQFFYAIYVMLNPARLESGSNPH
jgi:hypothetical protein